MFVLQIHQPKGWDKSLAVKQFKLFRQEGDPSTRVLHCLGQIGNTGKVNVTREAKPVPPGIADALRRHAEATWHIPENHPFFTKKAYEVDLPDLSHDEPLTDYEKAALAAKQPSTEPAPDETGEPSGSEPSEPTPSEPITPEPSEN